MARLVVGVAMLLAGCAPQEPVETYRLAAFGTDVTITVRHARVQDSEAVIAAIGRDLSAMHRRWHAWEPGMLTRLNQRLAAGERVAIDEDTAAILRQARDLESLSGGTFNPAIGRLLDLWGFHASQRPVGPPPARRDIEALVAAAPSMRDLDIHEDFVSSRNPVVQLDFGAYLKGVAVERALDRLAASGIEHAIVNAGGDLGVIGHRGTRPWRAAVEHPDGRGDRYMATLSVRPGEYVFTSGNYRRYRQGEGLRYGHIIDPRDGYPADGIRSITVIADAGGLADVAATALAVAGEADWPALAHALDIEHVLRVDGEGRISATPAMIERLAWRSGERPINEVSLPGGRGAAESGDQVIERHGTPEVEAL
jgi:thiamine biosynthesis lipoprotein